MTNTEHSESSRTFPFLMVSGAAGDRGFEHGRSFADRIQRAWTFYRQTLRNISDRTLAEAVQPITGHIASFFPELLEEMRGIAAGSGVAFEDIVALNSRTELLQLLELPPLECTSMYFAGSGILGQNWDFAEALEELTVILAVRHEDLTLLMLTEPGMIGKIGLNSAGVGVSLNRLGSRRRLDGVPVHVLLRAALECRSVAEIRHLLGRVRIGSESALIAADTTGDAASFELSGTRWGEHRNHAEYLVHANHYAGLVEEEFSTPEDVEHSMTRYLRAEELVRASPRDSAEEMFRLLRDRSHDLYPICRDYEPSPTLGRSGTISSIVMDLPRRQFHYTAGNPYLYQVQSIDLHQIR